MIMESNSTSEKVKETRKTIEELRHQLADSDSEDVISSKISEVLFHYFYFYGPYNHWYAVVIDRRPRPFEIICFDSGSVTSTAFLNERGQFAIMFINQFRSYVINQLKLSWAPVLYMLLILR